MSGWKGKGAGRAAHLEREDVVGGYAELPRARDVGVLRAAADRDQDPAGRDERLLPVLRRGLLALDGVAVDEGAPRVDVLHLGAPQAADVAVVELADVGLDVAPQQGPVVHKVASPRLGPAVGRGLVHIVPVDGRGVEKLLGDAPHVDAGAAQPPFAPHGRGSHVVQDGHLATEPCRLLRRGQPPRAPADDHEVVHETVGMVVRRDIDQLQREQRRRDAAMLGEDRPRRIFFFPCKLSVIHPQDPFVSQFEKALEEPASDTKAADGLKRREYYQSEYRSHLERIVHTEMQNKQYCVEEDSKEKAESLG